MIRLGDAPYGKCHALREYYTAHRLISNKFDQFILPEFFRCAWDLSEVDERPDAVEHSGNYNAPKLIKNGIEEIRVSFC